MNKDMEIIEKQRQSFKEFMQKHKLNAFAWAKKAGISEATIRHYLSGRNNSLTSVNLERLAKAVGARSEDLVGQIDSPRILEPLSIDNFEFSNLVEIKRDLFVQVFIDLDEFMLSNRINISAKAKANILLSWYQLAQILQRGGDAEISPELFKDLFYKIASEG